MNGSDLTPKAEPVAYAYVSALIVAVVASKLGLDEASAEAQLLGYVLPFLVAAVVSRFAVFAPDTVEDLKVQKGI